MDHVDECYALSYYDGRGVKGIVHMTIVLDTTNRVAASVDIDPNRTTITDPEFLECIRENSTAFEDHLERLRSQGEPIEGPITLHVAREMPPTSEGAELVSMSTGDELGDEDSLTCPAGRPSPARAASSGGAPCPTVRSTVPNGCGTSRAT